MNFPLKNIELEVNDEILQEGERLIAYNAIKRLEEVERNLWVSQLEEDATYEVEVMLTGTKVRATTCDCKFATDKNICSHIAATLLSILKIKKQKEVKKKQIKPTGATPKKLTTTSILNSVSSEDLNEFLKAYARNNKPFALALKARFVGKVQTLNDVEKYDQLIQSCINSVSKNTRKISINGMRQILAMLNELHDQVDKNIAIQNYLEAFAISKAIFNNIIPILQREAEGKKNLNISISQQFLSFKDLAVSKIPPALSQEIWDYTCDRFLNSLFFTYEIPDQFLSILQIMGTTKERQVYLIEIIDQAIDEGTLLQHTTVNLISTKIAFLEKLGKEKEIEKVVNENLIHLDILILAIENALHNDNLKRGKQLAFSGLKKEPDTHQKALLEEYLLKISILENDMDSTYEFAISRFINTHDFTFFEMAKKAVPNNWEAARADLIEKMRVGKFSIEKRNIIAKIFANEKMFEELYDYISNIRSLELLQKYDTLLFEFDLKKTNKLYTKIVGSFLRSHIGRQTSITVRSVITQLNKLEHRELAAQLVQLCRSDFSERRSLMEELADFSSSAQ